MIADTISCQTGCTPSPQRKKAGISGLSPDVLIFSLIVAGINIPVLWGDFSASLVFLPDRAASGEWLRVLLHPFVHLSWYHLLLDAGAFFLLYTGLSERRIPLKLFYVIICGTLSLLFAILFSPELKNRGLCGLSGIAHGLMAISALEMMDEEDLFWPGFASLLMVSGKSLYEFGAGQILFSFLQFDLCGTPVAVCHTGGWVGGIMGFMAIKAVNFLASLQK